MLNRLLLLLPLLCGLLLSLLFLQPPLLRGLLLLFAHPLLCGCLLAMNFHLSLPVLLQLLLDPGAVAGRLLKTCLVRDWRRRFASGRRRRRW